jgi:hypothetical protein
MTKTEIHSTSSSEFRDLEGLEYFDFEEDFIENNIRCIPMIVRFKMDLAGIKIRLDEWSRLDVQERIELAIKPCETQADVSLYATYTRLKIRQRTGRTATPLAIDNSPAWNNTDAVPELLKEKLAELAVYASLHQWRMLTPLQRFALLKLCRPGHENRNFPKALKEFGWL